MSPHDDTIEDFLDHVCAPLVGVVPYSRRQGLKAELRDLIEMRVEDGASAGEVIREMGDPYEVGQRFRTEWEQKPAEGRRKRWLRTGTMVALAHFGTLSVVALSFLIAARFENAPNMAVIGTGLGWLGPLAGLPFGWLHPARAAKNAAIATTIVGLHAALVAIVVGTGSEAFLRHSGFVFLIWLPAGAIVAWLSADAGRGVRRRRFWRDHRRERSTNGHPLTTLETPYETRF